MKNKKYENEVTNNMASSLGAAIRNSLTVDVQDDPNTAGQRLESLLNRMQNLGQFEDKQLVGVFISMMSQIGILSDVADYCIEHKLSNIETAKKVYSRYAKALLDKDFKQATKHAKVYNFYLKLAGGPEKYKSEDYLSMGTDNDETA